MYHAMFEIPDACTTSYPCRPAHSRPCSIAGSWSRDGRAIFVSASKWLQNERGSRPANTEVSVAMPSQSYGPVVHPFNIPNG